MPNPQTVVASDEYYTADMVRALNEAEPTYAIRYECVYGELLVSPAPAGFHQLVAGRLFRRLSDYVERYGLPYSVIMSPADVSWGRDDVTVQPDVFVIPIEMMRATLRAKSWDPIRHLVLACEVISPSSRRADRFKKRKLYQDRGVPLYWIVDHDERQAELWTPELHFPVIERERLVWHPEGASEPLTIGLDELFAEP